MERKKKEGQMKRADNTNRDFQRGGSERDKNSMDKKKKDNPMDGYDKTDRNFQRTADESDVKSEMGMRGKSKPAKK